MIARPPRRQVASLSPRFAAEGRTRRLSSLGFTTRGLSALYTRSPVRACSNRVLIAIVLARREKGENVALVVVQIFLSRVCLFSFNRDIPDYPDPVHLSLPPFFPSSPIIRLSRVASFLSLSTCLFFLFYVTRQSHWESSKKQRLSGQICLVYSDQRGYPSRVHTWLGIASSIGRAQHRSCSGTIVQSTHTIAEFTSRAQGYACSWASDEDPRLLSYLLRTRRFRLSRISRNGNRRWCYPVSAGYVRGVTFVTEVSRVEWHARFQNPSSVGKVSLS